MKNPKLFVGNLVATFLLGEREFRGFVGNLVWTFLVGEREFRGHVQAMVH